MTELWIITFALFLVRLATFWFVIPIWGGRKAPNTVKIGLVLALTMFWGQALDQVPQQIVTDFAGGANWGIFAVAVAREALIGGTLAFAFHMFFEPARIAGSYLAQELGLMLAAQADPTTAESTNVLATLFQAITILLFLVFDLHHFLIRCLDVSFGRLPVGSSFEQYPALIMSDGLADAVNLGILIATPAGVVLLVVLACLLILTRAVPTLNLFSIGLSIRLTAGLLALLIFLPHLIDALQRLLGHGRDFVESVLHAFV